jgi:phosphatidylglycerophosphatase A
MANSANDPRPLFSLAIATVFGLGYVPVAPGTFGSAAGLVLWALVPASAAAQGFAIIVLLVVGSVTGGVAERHYGQPDPGCVVIDEVMGVLVTLFLTPVSWEGAIGAFFLFRIADVVKPYPANRLEGLPGGVGVMADDLMAAVYANLALRATLFVLR